MRTIYLLARPDLPIYKDYTDFLLFVPDFAMVLTLAFWGLSFLVNHRRVRFGPAYLWIPLAGISLAGLCPLLLAWIAHFRCITSFDWLHCFSFSYIL